MKSKIGFCLIAVLMALAKPSAAQSTKSTVPDLTGVYQSISSNVALPGGLKNEGSPEEISILPAASAKAKAEAEKFAPDPGTTCQVIGPFRMMARDNNMIDIVASPRTNRTLIFFQDFFLGYMRQIFFDRRPPPKTKFAAEDPGQGNSFGHWEGDTLVVDTTNFNPFIWLNSKWTPHSDALHLIERYRLLEGGRYLELKMTAEDPNVLSKPYTYTRYFERVNIEVPQYFCTDDLVKHAIPDVK